MARILVVEDDVDLLFLYETMLSRLGYEVTPAERTSDAILLLTNDDFDLIILDMNMPDMPGIKVLEFVRDDVRLQHIPVVVVSANAQWRVPCADLGVEHFLIKPVPTRELFGLLHQLLPV
jgi:putative two-component system response regulator